jgi:HD superfamily phosphohydrolase
LYASDAKAVVVLRFKGVAISVEEENALYIAILLHDIGHGPFSHAMEKVLLKMYITRKSPCCLCIS